MASSLHVLTHPILQHKLGQLRDQNTSMHEFRCIVHELSMLMAYEATRGLATTNAEVLTPMGASAVTHIVQAPVVVAVMRAGNEMLDGVLSLLPTASAGHIGIYRDRMTEYTVEYYLRLPQSIAQKPVFLLDPMLATGDTLLACIDRLRQFDVGMITVLTLLASQVGVDKIHHYHPDVEIYTISVESDLTAQGFLLPGVGDMSNRLYGVTSNEATLYTLE